MPHTPSASEGVIDLTSDIEEHNAADIKRHVSRKPSAQDAKSSLNEDRKDGGDSADDDADNDDATESEDELDSSDDEVNHAELAAQYKEQANTYYSAKDYKTAIDLYSRSIELCPKEATYLLNRSAAYLMNHQYNESIDDCNAVILLDPLQHKAYARQAKCYIALGKYTEAQLILQKCADTLKQHNQAVPPTITTEQKEVSTYQQHYNHIQSTLTEQLDNPTPTTTSATIKTLMPQIEKLMAISPDALAIRCWMVESLILLKQVQNAQLLINTMYRTNKNEVEVIRLRGLTFMYAGDLTNSKSHMQQALTYDPDHKRARQALKLIKRLEAAKAEANAHFSANRNAEAVAAYTTCLELDSFNDHYNSIIYCNRGAAHMKLQDFASAISDCSMSITLNREYLKAYTRRSMARLEIEMFDAAISDLEAAKRLSGANEQELDELIMKCRKEQLKAKDEIRKAYRKMAIQYHPDKVGSSATESQRELAADKFKLINLANEVLSDAKKKAAYDRGDDVEEELEMMGYRTRRQHHHGGGRGGGMSQADMFAQMFAQQQARGGGGMGGMGGFGF